MAANPYGIALQAWDARLSPPALLAEAEAATGLVDWGGQRWNEAQFRHDFGVLCDALEETAALTQDGRNRAHSRLATMLVSRLRYLDARNQSRVDDQRIVAPLIGTGLPRAGTTFLHGLLAQDPGNRVAAAFEAAIPVPLDGVNTSALYADILAYQTLTREDLVEIHPFGSTLPEECIFLQEGVCGALYGVYWNVPAYQLEVAGKSAASYAWQKGVMQYLQASRPGGRWALKAPGHLHSWQEFLMAFPDARIYVNHRDPGKVIPSIASLFLGLRETFTSLAIDPEELGRGQLAAWGDAVETYRHWRSGGGADAFDILYTDLVQAPLDTAASLYDHFGIAFTNAAREAMLRHLEMDRHGKGPSRCYTLAEYGLDERQIEEVFAGYIEQFGIVREQRH